HSRCDEVRITPRAVRASSPTDSEASDLTRDANRLHNDASRPSAPRVGGASRHLLGVIAIAWSRWLRHPTRRPPITTTPAWIPPLNASLGVANHQSVLGKEHGSRHSSTSSTNFARWLSSTSKEKHGLLSLDEGAAEPVSGLNFNIGLLVVLGPMYAAFTAHFYVVSKHRYEEKRIGSIPSVVQRSSVRSQCGRSL
ncbi:unnamed protein product, partial [Caenorhabditis auriculariae]